MTLNLEIMPQYGARGDCIIFAPSIYIRSMSIRSLITQIISAEAVPLKSDVSPDTMRKQPVARSTTLVNQQVDLVPDMVKSDHT